MATPTPPSVPREPSGPSGESFKRQKLQNKLAMNDQKRRQQLEQRGSVVLTGNDAVKIQVPRRLSVAGTNSPVSTNSIDIASSPTSLSHLVSHSSHRKMSTASTQIIRPVIEKTLIPVSSNTDDEEIRKRSLENLQISPVKAQPRTTLPGTTIATGDQSRTQPAPTNISTSPTSSKINSPNDIPMAEELESPTNVAPVHPTDKQTTNPQPSQPESKSNHKEVKFAQTLAPMFDPLQEESTDTASDKTPESKAFRGLSHHKFVQSSCPTGKKYQCKIVRGKDTVEKSLYPHYEMYLEDSNDQVFLMSARKRKKSKTSNYILETKKASSKKKEDIVGKVRSNFLGTSFTIYDGGFNPFKEKEHDVSSKVRKEIASVIYDPNILGFKGPRKMSVIIPRMLKTGEAITVQPKTEADTILERHKKGALNDLLILHNKTPQWNEESQSYVLNFNGRVTMASVKNFQVVHDNDPDYVIMQFGRVNDDTFSLDFQYPMSPLQAFAIALTSFDAKLACE